MTIFWHDKDVKYKDEDVVWEVQLYVEVSDWKGHGEVATFTVYEIL